jgi:uncharacterized protein YjbI with pentapeptide repeats
MPKDFSGQNLRGKSFKGQDLTGANFSGADIRGVNFQNAILVGANFNTVKAGVACPAIVIQVVTTVVLVGLSGIFSAFAGYLVVALVETMIANIDIVSPNVDVVIVTGGLSLLLAGILVVFIRKGRIVTGAVVGAGTVIGIGVVIGIVATIVTMAEFEDVAADVTAAMVIAMALVVPVVGTAIVAETVAMIIAEIRAGTRAITLTGIVTWAIAVAIAVAIVLERARTEAVAIGTGVGIGVTIGTIIVIATYMGWRTFHEDKQFAVFLKLAIAFTSLGGTNFRGADLTNTDFAKAILKNTRFRNATITRTCWQCAKHLSFARLTGIILADRGVRELLVTGDGSGQSFAGKDLRGAYLVGATLSNADLSEADISGVSLQGADLREANLTKTTALGVNFRGADLTGACVDAWNIDSTTQLEGASCEYIYLLGNQQERRPNSGIFGEGEFSKLFQEVLHTVDFIFKNGIDWQAFLVTFDSIREKIRIESDGADIAVQSIENKGDGVFVVKVVAQELDKESLHREFTEQYKQQLAIQEAKYQSLLQGKEEVIALQRQQAIDMKEILQTLMEKQSVNIIGEVVLGDKRTIQTGRDYFEHVEGDVTTGESASEPKKDP